MDGESVQKSLSTFHARFQQEKMKVVKADTEDQDFQRQVKRTRETETERGRFPSNKMAISSNGSLIIILKG